MSKTLTFEGKVLDDGHLLIPDELKRKLKLKAGNIVNGIIKSIVREDISATQLLSLAGKWKDNRSAEDIINDIYHRRTSSPRLTKGL